MYYTVSKVCQKKIDFSNVPKSFSLWSYSIFNDAKGGFEGLAQHICSLEWTFLFSAEKLRNCIWKKCDHDKEVVFLLWCHYSVLCLPTKLFLQWEFCMFVIMSKMTKS